MEGGEDERAEGRMPFAEPCSIPQTTLQVAVLALTSYLDVCGVVGGTVRGAISALPYAEPTQIIVCPDSLAQAYLLCKIVTSLRKANMHTRSPSHLALALPFLTCSLTLCLPAICSRACDPSSSASSRHHSDQWEGPNPKWLQKDHLHGSQGCSGKERVR
jgi:hypothetical protein